MDSIVSSRRRMLLERLLPVLDNLQRALQSNAGGETLRGGLEQTLRGFEAVLASEGVKPIEVKGQPFDPRVAEAVGTAPSDGVAEDTVVDVAEKGYTLGDDLLRPAKVIVATRPGE
jgi:molecular chaperone GrpE